jgi:hypothetical protein
MQAILLAFICIYLGLLAFIWPPRRTRGLARDTLRLRQEDG